MIKKNVLLVGKSGFVSTRFQKLLKSKKIKFQVIGSKEIDLISDKSSKKLEKFNKGNNLYTIYFFSALTPDKGKDEFTLIDNIKMISNFLKFFPIQKVKKFIYISSDAIFGNISKINDQTQPIPSDLYGSMHLIREKIIESHFDKSKIIILRPTAIFGFGDTHNSYGPNRFINQAVNKGEITLFGQGLDKRDHLFIDDFINVLLSLISSSRSGAFNVANEKSVTFKSIALQIKDIFKNKYKKNVSLTYINNDNEISIKNFKKIDQLILNKMNTNIKIYSKIDDYISNFFKK